MRNGQHQHHNHNKRMRGRNNHNNNNNNNNNNRRNHNPLTRVYESNGPDVKIRGTANHVAEKYLQLARDAQTSGDPIAAENYFQHAEHYFRLIAVAQEQFRQQNPNFQPRPEGSGGNDQQFAPRNEGVDEGGEDDGQPFNDAGFGAREQPQPYVPRERNPICRATHSRSCRATTRTSSRASRATAAQAGRKQGKSGRSRSRARRAKQATKRFRPSSPAVRRSRRPRSKRTIRTARTASTMASRTVSRCIAAAAATVVRAATLRDRRAVIARTIPGHSVMPRECGASGKRRSGD